MKLDRLMHLLTEQAKMAGRKELFCAPDVAEALARAVPPAEPRPVWDLTGSLWGMLAVDIIPEPEAAPGSFRLVKHYVKPTGWSDGGVSCTVDANTGTVTHEWCWVVAEDVLEAAA